VLGKAKNDVRAMRAARALAEARYTVSIVDIKGENEHIPSEEYIDRVRIKHISVPTEFITTRFKQWVFLRAALIFMRGILRLLQEPADVYHALDLPALPACYIAALLRRKPLIFESYELPLSTLPLSEMSRSRRFLQALMTPLLAHIIPHSAGVIAVSPPIVQEIRKRYRIPEVSLLRNIPEYKNIKRTNRLRRYLGLGPEMRIALYQGNIQPDRGLDGLVQAASFLDQDIIIVIMGQDMVGTKAQLEMQIERGGWTDRVKIIPPVPYSELLEWTSSADIGLITSSPDYSLNTQMMLPNKLFEFLMAGLPVLSTQLEATVEVIQKYEVGQVMTSHEPAEIGAAINAMIADPNALASMRQNALRAVQKELNWETEKQHLICLYRECSM
jgi:glycosyltransferase involved in cell wall biosynthesis